MGAIPGGGVSAYALRHGTKSLTRITGKEWSHSIANRVVNKHTSGGLNKALNKRGGLNGSWASNKRHYRHDPSRNAARGNSREQFGKRWHPLARGLDRIPDWLKGSAASGLFGAGITGGGSCGCGN